MTSSPGISTGFSVRPARSSSKAMASIFWVRILSNWESHLALRSSAERKFKSR